jgi:uncharacterized protein YbjT (DUF2867 family)
MVLTIAAFALLFTSSADAAKVLLFGGTGQTGAAVAKGLVARGDQVVVFARTTSNRARLEGLPVSYVIGDVNDEKSVETALMSVRPDYVLSALQDRPNQKSPHGDGENATVKWSKAAGVKQLIYISSVGAGDGPASDRARYPDINWALFLPVLKEKGAAERYLIDSGVPYTIIRTGAIITQRGKPPHPGTGKGYLTEDQNVMGPIAYSDLGRVTVDCFGAAKCINKIFHVTDDDLGPEYKHWRCRRFAKDADKECG